jgi:outer membrane protein insertion porin family/translocation and assembly module TamA
MRTCPKPKPARAAVSLASLALLSPLLGCGSIFTSIPKGQTAVDSVRIVNAKELEGPTVASKISTTESPRFLGIFSGIIYEYQVLDPSALQRDLARIERYYRGQGFLEAHARAARIIHTASDHVKVEIVVDEGKPTLNRNVKIDGIDDLPPPISDGVKAAAAAALPKNKRFDEEAYKTAQTTVLRALTDRGYAYATSQVNATADLDAHAIDYTFTMKPGIEAIFGPIKIVGLDPDGKGPRPQEIGEPPLLRAMGIQEGDPYSTAKLDSATQALLDLEVFSGVHMMPQLSDPPGQVVPLTVEVEPSKLRSLRIGGGFEFDQIKTDIHGLVGWENHNFLGDLRDFSVTLKPGVVLFPFRVGNGNLTNVFPEERLTVTLEQPGFIEGRTTGFVRPAINVYPLLVEPNPDPAQPVVGYLEPKGAIGVRRTFWDHLNVSLQENIQGEIPFPYTGRFDSSTLPDIILSYPQLITTLDFRDDPVHPHKGFYVTNDFQVAGGPFGGNATDVRIAPEVRGYVPLSTGVTFALRGAIGLLFPSNYGDYVQSHLGETVGSDLPPGAAQRAAEAINRDIELVYFRGFFSGGLSSNRGYPVRGIAPHGVVPFLSPATASQQAASNCDPNTKSYDPSSSACSVPIGGFTQWEASAEMRFQSSGPLGMALFCDAADVSRNEVDFRNFSYLHLSCGIGARYDIPQVGPIRLDIGYRIQPLQVIGYPSETAVFSGRGPGLPQQPSEGQPPTLFGSWLPGCCGINFGIGESF